MSSDSTMSAPSLSFARAVVMQPSRPVAEAVELAASNGCTHVYVEGAYADDGVAAWTDQRLAETAALLDTRDVRPIFHGNYKNPLASNVQEIRESAIGYARREIELAGRLDAPIILHGSAIFSHGNPDDIRAEARRCFSESVRTLVSAAQDKDVDIWLENLEYYRDAHPFHTIFSTAEDYAYVLEQVPEVGFTLDIGHENVSTGQSVEVFEQFHDRIVAIDVNDNDGVVDTHWPLGKGNVDFARLLEAVRRTGWAGYLTFETRGATVSEGLAYLASLRGDDVPDH